MPKYTVRWIEETSFDCTLDALDEDDAKDQVFSTYAYADGEPFAVKNIEIHPVEKEDA